jgi:hypothetical protein
LNVDPFESGHHEVIFIKFTLFIFFHSTLSNDDSKVPSPSPRIMSPMGFAINRQARHLASVMDENSTYGDDWDDVPPNSYIKPVPIWLCVFLVIGYILGGAYMFHIWEGWTLLDSAYFCFITLTTIGKETLTIAFNYSAVEEENEDKNLIQFSSQTKFFFFFFSSYTTLVSQN